MNKRFDPLGWAAAALLMFTQPALAARPAAKPESMQAMVTHISDGDSLWIKPDAGVAIKLRLRDVDAPEICQSWGPQSRSALESLLLHQSVNVQVSGRDSYGRSVGLVFLDGVNIGTRQVEEGHAWSARTRWDRGPLVKQERVARALARGLHSQSDAENPRDFRKRNGPCAPAADASGVSSAVPRDSPARAP